MDRRGIRRFGFGTTILVLIAALVAVAAAGCGGEAGATGGAINLGAADNGKTISVNVGDTIKVVLAANETTGYSWAAQLSSEGAALIEQVGDEEYSPDSTDEAVVGSGGTATLTFKAVAKGEAQLQLTYAQQFDPAGVPAETFTVNVTIK